MDKTDIQMKRLSKILAGRGWDPVYGARPLKRAIQKYIIDPLSTAILEGKYKDGDAIRADAKGDEIIFQAPNSK